MTAAVTTSLLRENFANTGMLSRYMMKREARSILLWILILGGVIVALVPGLYYALPAEERFTIVDMLGMPVMVSMVGPAYAMYHHTFGAMYTNFMLLFSALTAALMNIFLVIRLTRADEEKGRYEVVRSLPVGRLSNLSAAMIAALCVNAGLAVFTGAGMALSGAVLYDSGMCVNGSILWGVTLGTAGMVFAALTALFAQLTASARTAMGYSFMALGVFYLLRAPGDMGTRMGGVDLTFLAYVSPMGLLMRTEAYMGNYWTPILIMLATAALITAAAMKLTAIRDIDQGLIPAKPGRAHGSFLTKGAGGLAFKLTRTSIIVWFVSIFVVGAAYGAVLGTLDEFIATNEMYQGLILGPFGITIPQGLELEAAVAYLRGAVGALGITLPQVFSAMINMLMGIFATVPAVLLILKARSEEADTRTELILAASVSRRKYLMGYVVLAFIMAALVQFATGMGMFLSGAAVMESLDEFPLAFAMQVGFVYVPAVWVKVGAAVLLAGAFPKGMGLIWAYFAYTFVFLFFGRGFGIFPEWMAYLSPHAFVQQLPLAPGEQINILQPVVKTVLALALSFAGLHFYAKRDINAVTN